MRKAKAIRTWAVVAVLAAGVLVTLACDGKKATFPTQPAARNFTFPETTVVTAAFQATGVDGLKTVIFTDLSTGNVTKWRWDFGDGTKSSAQNPIHDYKKFGVFVVTLTVSNSISSDTLSVFLEVVDTEAEPEPEG